MHRKCEQVVTLSKNGNSQVFVDGRLSHLAQCKDSEDDLSCINGDEE